jgi:Carboxypeptidase regulatory-like domain
VKRMEDMKVMNGIQRKTFMVFMSCVPIMSSWLWAQTPGGADVRGRVLDATTRQPVRGATVAIGPGVDARMMDAGHKGRTFLTGSDGVFAFRNLTPGVVEILAAKTGFFTGGFGKRRPSGVTGRLTLESSRSYDNIELLVWPVATISGTVFDGNGEPLPGVSVGAWRLGIAPGSTEQPSYVARSDDRGRYRIDRLPPGDYAVGVRRDLTSSSITMPTEVANQFLPGRALTYLMESMYRTEPGDGVALAPTISPGGKRHAYVGSYYGRVTDMALATAVTLSPGDDRTGIDLFMRLEPTYEVSGTITWLGSPAPSVLTLSSDTVRISASSRLDGTFAIPVVPAGSYTLSAQRPLDTSPATIVTAGYQFGRVDLVVRDHDIRGLEIPLRMGATVSGLIEVPAQMNFESVRLKVERTTLASVNRTAVSAFVERGPFALNGVLPGEYVMRIDFAPQALVLESVELGGRNITDVPLQIDTQDFTGLIVHLTDRPASIAGTILRPDGKPSSIGSVVLFPTDASTWNARAPLSGTQFQVNRAYDGTFAFNRVPRGEYFLTAVDDALLEDWREPASLSKLAVRAVRVTVKPGDAVRRDFTLEER